MTNPYPRPPATYQQPGHPQPGNPPVPSYGQAPSTPSSAEGGSRIEAALQALAEVRDAPPAEQVAPLTQAHRVLRETLESIGDV